MTEFYHGTPITPLKALHCLQGKKFCVSFARPDQINIVLEIGAEIMIDCGAFTTWMQGRAVDEAAYYLFAEQVLMRGGVWAVILDFIDSPEEMQDAALQRCPLPRHLSAPVWHMNEGIPRLLALCEKDFNRVCIGSTSLYRTVLSFAWRYRMDDVWNEIVKTFGTIPKIHMLRGMQCAKFDYPFYSLDSTNIARNHKSKKISILEFANEVERVSCPTTWQQRGRLIKHPV